ncbi:hypothetical protein NKH71_09250 [Mesorhizobium sp. M0983]|uniref:hypothetical protein n=1 Tax=Mesorhizobium sp. M0983 TaxID=2957040 RepID=UPI00333C84CB
MILSAIPLSLERLLRRRLNRIPSLPIQTTDRQKTSDILSEFEAIYPHFSDKLFIFHMSTTEFSSEFRVADGIRIVALDYEQINAINWFMNLSLKIEHPIFHYNEFMIRSGELLASWGEVSAARRIHARLVSSWTSFNKSPTTPNPYWRPFFPIGLISMTRVVEYLANAFVLGHEIGHHFGTLDENDATKYANTIANEFFAGAMYEDSLTGDGPKFTSFFSPPIDVKLDEHGSFSGQATRGMFLIKYFELIKSQQKSEIFCDYFAFIAVSIQSAKRKTPPIDVISSLILCIEGVEGLTYLTNTLQRTPRSRRRTAVRFDNGNAKLRIAFLLHLIDLSSRGKVELPESVCAYWLNMDDDARNRLELLQFRYGRNSIADMTKFLSRGAFCLGSGMPFPKLSPPPDELPTGPDGIIHMAEEALLIPWRFPSSIYRIEENHGWTPEQPGDPAVIGFASALTDAVECVFGQGAEMVNSKPQKEAAIRLVRSPRLRLLDPDGKRARTAKAARRGAHQRSSRPQRTE